MHTIPTTIRAATLSALAAAAARTASRLWKAWRNRRQVVMLVEADDRMLADIGLTRSDLNSALSSPVSEDPSFYLARARHERLRNRARHRIGL